MFPFSFGIMENRNDDPVASIGMTTGLSLIISHLSALSVIRAKTPELRYTGEESRVTSSSWLGNCSSNPIQTKAVPSSFSLIFLSTSNNEIYLSRFSRLALSLSAGFALSLPALLALLIPGAGAKQRSPFLGLLPSGPSFTTKTSLSLSSMIVSPMGLSSITLCSETTSSENPIARCFEFFVHPKIIMLKKIAKTIFFTKLYNLLC